MNESTFTQYVNERKFEFVRAIEGRKDRIDSYDGESVYFVQKNERQLIATREYVADEDVLVQLVCKAYKKDQFEDVYIREAIDNLYVEFPINEVITSKLEQLSIESQNPETQPFTLTCWFYELLYLVLQQLNDQKKDSLQSRLADTKTYIDQFYNVPLTRVDLAQRAGVNVDYFSRTFKARYEESPMSYLNRVRITHAKSLLLKRNKTIRDIAFDVGFKDEFYFSRQFKRQIGRSPQSYMKRSILSLKVASLHHLVTGHLYALNHLPHSAIMNHSYPLSLKEAGVVEIGQESVDVDKLVTIQPDVVIQKAPMSDAVKTKSELINQIAPVVNLAYEGTWREHFTQIASVVDCDQRAQQWLEHYEHKASSIRDSIKKYVGKETVIVVGIGEVGCCLYGMRNMGAVMYDDLQMEAPERIRKIAHIKEVTLEELMEINADRIILTVYRSHKRLPSQMTIVKHLQQLSQDERWQSLKAVKNKQLYGLYDTKHLYTSYNAYSHNLLLNKLSEFFVT
ncbi:ABC-type Fe3+-hydroxamate transport system substrate-binding protein [Geomicrobium sediminis]|uniref:ABC-type Fe3+-hydroxamate transport system substrate-binding protein n=2 Tax=Geomicrobium sediminis TaxID=1347788 RepID=A0ABS2PHI4_9BACL|nr:ABC-type Fe3+-hydroxamate transport system substrate-binding protein [Geomicrobium sediminis]